MATLEFIADVVKEDQMHATPTPLIAFALKYATQMNTITESMGASTLQRAAREALRILVAVGCRHGISVGKIVEAMHNEDSNDDDVLRDAYRSASEVFILAQTDAVRYGAFNSAMCHLKLVCKKKDIDFSPLLKPYF